MVRAFAEAVPAIRQYTIKGPLSAHLRYIHPRAYIFIAEHGRNYAPIILSKPPSLGEPQWAHCFHNALYLMRVYNQHPHPRPIVYVEGFTLGSAVDPMIHAWNAYGLEGRRALDWTLYASCRWSRYIGVPFTQEEYERIRDKMAPHKGDTVMSMFHKRYFLYWSRCSTKSSPAGTSHLFTVFCAALRRLTSFHIVQSANKLLHTKRTAFPRSVLFFRPGRHSVNAALVLPPVVAENLVRLHSPPIRQPGIRSPNACWDRLDSREGDGHLIAGAYSVRVNGAYAHFSRFLMANQLTRV